MQVTGWIGLYENLTVSVSGIFHKNQKALYKTPEEYGHQVHMKQAVWDIYIKITKPLILLMKFYGSQE